MLFSLPILFYILSETDIIKTQKKVGIISRSLDNYVPEKILECHRCYKLRLGSGWPMQMIKKIAQSVVMAYCSDTTQNLKSKEALIWHVVTPNSTICVSQNGWSKANIQSAHYANRASKWETIEI
jgi:hypothetical protein